MIIATATLPAQPRAHSFREGQRILGISRSTSLIPRAVITFLVSGVG